MPPKKKSKGAEGVPVDVAEDKETNAKSKRGRKKSKGNGEDDDGDAGESDSKTPKVLLNKASTEFHNQDFTCKSTTEDGKSWNLKVATWNVDGIRAWIKKGGVEYITREDPDILCLQEVKCATSKLPEDVTHIDGYHVYWCHSENEGYAGVGLFSKLKPISVNYGIGLEELDKEGRLIIAEYDKFYLLNVYVPNAGRKLVTLPRRINDWDPKFRQLVKELDAKKPVIVCGDMNVAHEEIDIANPKPNKRNAGFTQEERDGFSDLLKSDSLIDCFRRKYPDAKGAYTFWTYLANARKKNVGWRLDYCLISDKLSGGLCDCLIRSEVYGSNHCPVVLFLHV